MLSAQLLLWQIWSLSLQSSRALIGTMHSSYWPKLYLMSCSLNLLVQSWEGSCTCVYWLGRASEVISPRQSICKHALCAACLLIPSNIGYVCQPCSVNLRRMQCQPNCFSHWPAQDVQDSSRNLDWMDETVCSSDNICWTWGWRHLLVWR